MAIAVLFGETLMSIRFTGISSVIFTFCIILSSAPICLSASNQPFISYVALSDAARKSGQLNLYEKVHLQHAKMQLGKCSLSVSIPTKARAYDVIPIHYTIKRPHSSGRLALEAVAFEDNKRAKGKPLYDLAIPGKMSIKVDYLGSVCADLNNSSYIPLSADPKCPISPFPPFKRDKLVRSSTIREAQVVWFKFRLTNTGNTILDPEGFGGWLQQPLLAKVDSDGTGEWTTGTINLFQRELQYMYPGDSEVIWVNFNAVKNSRKDYRLGLEEGLYRIDLKFLFRSYRKYDWELNMWGGDEFARFELPIKVKKKGAQTPIWSRMWYADLNDNMPGYFNRFEEFMTSFRIWRSTSTPTTESGTIYIQPAPWTKNITLKLIQTDPQKISTVSVPIKMTDETLKIKYNPNNVMVINDKGKEKPVILAQPMPAMRTGFQLGPYPEEHMQKELEELKSLGVNLLSNTCGGWWIPEVDGKDEQLDLHSACYKYWYDVLIRKFGMKTVGNSLYPPSGPDWFDNVEPILGKKIDYHKVNGGYNNAAECVDLGEPIIPEVIAAWAKYSYARWGDCWFRTKDGRMPIDIEDTWGWMRYDINTRYPLGSLALQQFRDWLKDKYTTIEQVNLAWGSNYAGFSEIDPQANQGVEGDNISHDLVYNRPDNIFHDWTKATEDWDEFRTQLRLNIYKKADEIIRKTIPGAELSVRTEGANIPIKGDGKSDDMHWRHVYYSQRRNAFVYDIVKSSDVVHFYGDYTTMPYTPDEWRSAMREMVKNGIIPMFLPQFDHMRDIVLNPYYGRNYKMHYNLDKPAKCAMVHCLMAAYPWWKATYEEGGAPGIIWDDHLCDGFATETQKHELMILRKNLDTMKRN